MVTTAATIIIDKKTNRILLCHVTEHDFWSLPKGVQEDGELLISTALREVEEETGLVFDDDGVAASAITYHDTYSYIKNKNMAVFSIQVHEIDLSKLKCASTFVSDIGLRCAQPSGRESGVSSRFSRNYWDGHP